MRWLFEVKSEAPFSWKTAFIDCFYKPFIISLGLVGVNYGEITDSLGEGIVLAVFVVIVMAVVYRVKQLRKLVLGTKKK